MQCGAAVGNFQVPEQPVFNALITGVIESLYGSSLLLTYTPSFKFKFKFGVPACKGSCCCCQSAPAKQRWPSWGSQYKQLRLFPCPCARKRHSLHRIRRRLASTDAPSAACTCHSAPLICCCTPYTSLLPVFRSPTPRTSSATALPLTTYSAGRHEQALGRHASGLATTAAACH